MEAKIVFVLCVQSILLQYISSQCVNSAYDNLAWSNAANTLSWESSPYAYASPSWPAAPQATSYATAEWASNYAPNLAASNGGGLPVTSTSQIPPSGVYMASENAYSGPLAVSGAMPFLGTVTLEGALPTAGSGAVSYSCGNGNVAMINENVSGYNAYNNYGYGASIPEYSYGYAPSASEYAYSYAPLSGCSNSMAIDSGIVSPAYGYNYRY